MPLLNCPNVSRCHADCLLKNTPKHIRYNDQERKNLTWANPEIARWGAKPSGLLWSTVRAKKKKKKNSRKKITCMKDLHKRYHNRKQRKSKSKPKTKTKKEPFQTSSWLQKYFSYFFKISKNVQHQGFFSFFFLQSHASTFIFIIIITLIWIIIWMIYRTVIIIVI